jgi:hypothetical protein
MTVRAREYAWRGAYRKLTAANSNLVGAIAIGQESVGEIAAGTWRCGRVVSPGDRQVGAAVWQGSAMVAPHTVRPR